MSVCGPKVDILIYYRGVERPTLFALNEVGADLVLDARVVLKSRRVQARGLHGANAKHNGKRLSG